MALTPCIECQRNISSRAASCPHCGCPVAGEFSAITGTPEQVILQPLADNLSIGEQIVNWGADAIVDVEFHYNENPYRPLPEGKLKVFVYTAGIRISVGTFGTSIDVHKSQIIAMQHDDYDHVTVKQKSAFGRALLGGVILGPVGAVAGGMSAMTDKRRTREMAVLRITFREADSERIQTLTMHGRRLAVEMFIRRYDKEMLKNKPVTPPGYPWGGCIIIILFIALIVWWIMS
jgi:hypothetical protein